MSEKMPKIERAYLLVCPIPHYLHADGSIWLDRLWHHDLAEHLTYLRDLTLLSPRLAWFAGGRPVAIFAVGSLLFILLTGLWPFLMLSTYLCALAVVLCLLIGA